MFTGTTDDRRALEFFGVMAGLLGVVVTLLPAPPSQLNGLPVKQFFAVFLTLYLLYSALAYVALVSRSKSAGALVYSSEVYFSFLVGWALVLAASEAAIGFGVFTSYLYDEAFVLVSGLVAIVFASVLWRLKRSTIHRPSS